VGGEAAFRPSPPWAHEMPLVKDGHSTWDTDDVIAPQVIAFNTSGCC